MKSRDRGGVGRKKTNDNTRQSDKDDKVHDKSLATGYSSAISFSFDQWASTQACKHYSLPLAGAKHNLLTLTSSSLLFITHFSHCGGKDGVCEMVLSTGLRSDWETWLVIVIARVQTQYIYCFSFFIVLSPFFISCEGHSPQLLNSTHSDSQPPISADHSTLVHGH